MTGETEGPPGAARGKGGGGQKLSRGPSILFLSADGGSSAGHLYDELNY